MSKIRQYFIGIIVVVIFLIFMFSNKYLDWLWYQSMNAGQVFWVTLITGPLTKLIIGIFILIFLLINLLLALRSFNRIRSTEGYMVEVSIETVVFPGFFAAIVISFFLASGFSLNWEVIQQFLNRVSTGITDPIFKHDLGFYLFSFPFYQKLNSLIQIILFFGIIGSGLIYFLARAFWREGRSWQVWQPAKIHLTLLLILFLGSKLWGYSLSRFNLLYQESARLTGVNYTAAHANLLGINILTWVVVGLIGLLIVNVFRKTNTLIIGGLGVWLVLSVIFGGIYPGVIQSFVVNPNEFDLEKSYIQNHIQFTRQAYDLERIKIKPFKPEENQNPQLNSAHPSINSNRFVRIMNLTMSTLTAILPLPASVSSCYLHGSFIPTG